MHIEIVKQQHHRDHSQQTSNPFYNSDLARDLLENYFSLLPLWTSLITGERQNNGPVESWFKTVKEHILDGVSTPATIIRALKPSVFGRIKCFKFGLKVRKRKLPSGLEKEDATVCVEKWAKRSKNSKPSTIGKYFQQPQVIHNKKVQPVNVRAVDYEEFLSVSGMKLLLTSFETLDGTRWLDDSVSFCKM